MKIQVPARQNSLSPARQSSSARDRPSSFAGPVSTGRPGFNLRAVAIAAPTQTQTPAHPHPILRNLMVTGAGDASEQEADRVMRQVVHRIGVPAPPPHRVPPSASAAQTSHVPMWQRGGAKMEGKQSIASGEPMEEQSRAAMEPAFGYSFANVRIHRDALADRLSRGVGARAFTVGTDLFFRQAEYHPQTSRGKALLAHELTHVVQQQAAKRLPPSFQQSEQRNDGAPDRDARHHSSISVSEHLAHPAIQRLIGLEVEVNAPVSLPPLGPMNAAAEIGAFLAGNVKPKAELKPYQDSSPYRLTVDGGGVSSTVVALHKIWGENASDPHHYLQRTAGMPKRLEFVTEPYSEIHDTFDVQGKERGLTRFKRDLKTMIHDIRQTLISSRRGYLSTFGQWQVGLPGAHRWSDAATAFKLGATWTEQEAMGNLAHRQVLEAMTEDVYVQSNLGILPEKIAAFQQYHQETTGLKYPLAVSNPSLAQQVQTSTEAQLQVYLERSASSKAEELAGDFAIGPQAGKGGLQMAATRFAAFRGYLLTVLMSLGGQAIREAEVQAKGERLEASGKNIFNLLPKTPLTILQAQLPDEINPAVWEKQSDERYGILFSAIETWFVKVFLPGCAKIAAARQNQQLTLVFQKFSLETRGLNAWLFGLLSGEEDLFAEAMLIPDESDLPPEKVERGARQGAQLTPGGNPTQAIPFETRFPTTHIPLGELETYTDEVIDSLNKAHR